MNISIIIPVLNEESNLLNLFQSLNQQKLPVDVKVVDIIVVDNGSTDNSVLISKEYCTDIFIMPNASISELRNAGAESCDCDILIFIDADCVLADDALMSVANLLSGGNVAAVGPDGLPPYGDTTWLQKIWYFHTKVINGCKHTIDATNLSSGFLAIKTNVFKSIHGFNGNLSIGEDSDLSNRLILEGFKIVKSNLITVYNSGHPRSIKQFIKREFWHGDSFKHLIVHKNIDLLTIYLIINLLLLLLIMLNIIFIHSISLLALNIILVISIPLYKSILKVKKPCAMLFQLFAIYSIYVVIRSLALLKLNINK